MASSTVPVLVPAYLAHTWVLMSSPPQKGPHLSRRDLIQDLFGPYLLASATSKR